MKRENKNIERMNARCLLLEQLGFEIQHEDSYVTMFGIEFDFSAVEGDLPSILQTAVSIAYDQGQIVGREQIRSGIKQLLNGEQD